MIRRLRAARVAVDLRQVEVAQLLGRPQSYVSKIETCERRIDPVELRRFAVLYKTRLEDLVPDEAWAAEEVSSRAKRD